MPTAATCGFSEPPRGDPTAIRTNCFSTAIRRSPGRFPALGGVANPGSVSVIWGGREPVPKLAFDEIVDLATNHGEKQVRLLKLDCEGAEWPILLPRQRP